MSREKLDMVRICFGAAFADGEVQDEEKKVLFDLAEKFGLSMAEISDIWEEFASGQKHKVVLPKSQEDREALLQGLLKVALADSEVTHSEDRFLRRLARKMNLSDEIDRQREMWGDAWPDYSKA